MVNNSQKTAPVCHNRVLVLDDNDGNRLLIKFVLQMQNIELVEASDARSALALWRPGAFSFAFLDIELPDISGLEVARQLRASDEKVAVIMCSTNDDPRTIRAAVQVGCDLFLVKPFQLDILINLVRTMDRCHLRSASRVLVIDNTARHRWEARPEQPKAQLLLTN